MLVGSEDNDGSMAAILMERMEGMVKEVEVGGCKRWRKRVQKAEMGHGVLAVMQSESKQSQLTWF